METPSNHILDDSLINVFYVSHWAIKFISITLSFSTLMRKSKFI